jgi:hypothetical protein
MLPPGVDRAIRDQHCRECSGDSGSLRALGCHGLAYCLLVAGSLSSRFAMGSGVPQPMAPSVFPVSTIVHNCHRAIRATFSFSFSVIGRFFHSSSVTR